MAQFLYSLGPYYNLKDCLSWRWQRIGLRRQAARITIKTPNFALKINSPTKLAAENHRPVLKSNLDNRYAWN
jgi:hypothetical protein